MHFRAAVIVALLACALAFSGCKTTSEDEPSGFLTSYSGFRPGPEGTVDRIWVPQTVASRDGFSASLEGYDKVIIDPIWTSMRDDDSFDGVDPKQLHELVTLFRKDLVQALAPAYPVVEDPAPGVMRLSIALTGIESPSRFSSIVGFTPGGLAISAVSRLATGEGTGVGSATMESLATDSMTGDTLFAVIDHRAGTKGLEVIEDPLSDAKKAFKWWATRLRKTLDAAHSGQTG